MPSIGVLQHTNAHNTMPISIFQLCGTFVIGLAILNMGTLGGYPTNSLPQWRNETNIQVLSSRVYSPEIK